MNDKTRRVFIGWLNLTVGERQELEADIRRFNTSTESVQRQLRESTGSSVMKMDEPRTSSSACCGSHRKALKELLIVTQDRLGTAALC